MSQLSPARQFMVDIQAEAAQVWEQRLPEIRQAILEHGGTALDIQNFERDKGQYLEVFQLGVAVTVEILARRTSSRTQA